MIVAWLSLLQVSMRCCQGSVRLSSLVCACCPGCGDANMRSCRAASLKASTSLAVTADLGSGFCHIRQALHVSTMSGIMLIAALGAPVALRMFSKRFRGTCHQRRCSILKVRRTTPGLSLRSSWRHLPMSSLVHSAVSEACVDMSRGTCLPIHDVSAIGARSGVGCAGGSW